MWRKRNLLMISRAGPEEETPNINRDHKNVCRDIGPDFYIAKLFCQDKCILERTLRRSDRALRRCPTKHSADPTRHDDMDCASGMTRL